MCVRCMAARCSRLSVRDDQAAENVSSGGGDEPRANTPGAQAGRYPVLTVRFPSQPVSSSDRAK